MREEEGKKEEGTLGEQNQSKRRTKRLENQAGRGGQHLLATPWGKF